MQLSAFAGTWRAHSFMLVVQPDGTATADWRVYRWCHTGEAGVCDQMHEGRIISGGHAALVLDRTGTDRAGAEIATGGVITSSDTATLPSGPVQVVRTAAGRVRLYAGPRNAIDVPALLAELCGPGASRSTDCGA